MSSAEQPGPDRSPMLELGQRFREGKISRADLELAALLGHQPAGELVQLMGGIIPNAPSSTEEWLEVLEKWDGASIRALIASVHARITSEEIGLENLPPEERPSWERSTRESRTILNTVESYFLTRSTSLGLDLTAAASTLDEAIGVTASMSAEGQLSEKYLRVFAIDLELEKIIRLLGFMLEEVHSLRLPPIDLQAVRRELITWAIEKKDPLQERIVTRNLEQRTKETKDDVSGLSSGESNA